MRLVSKARPSSNDPGGAVGRLEIFHNGVWGTVCSSGFGQTEADVVCQQLGYDRAYSYGDNLRYKDHHWPCMV